MRRVHRSVLAVLPALLLAGLGSLPCAQIRSLSLAEMARAADGAVHGQITAVRVFRADDPADGPGLYYTTLTIQGRALADARALTVDVTFRGGFVSATEGVFNSEAPAADDIQVGRTVVAFYRWSDDLGGGVPANALVAAHGGLYRTVEGPRGPTALGRGPGYAIAANVRVEELEGACNRLHGRRR
jgi:hypothetical protein